MSRPGTGLLGRILSPGFSDSRHRLCWFLVESSHFYVLLLRVHFSASWKEREKKHRWTQKENRGTELSSLKGYFHLEEHLRESRSQSQMLWGNTISFSNISNLSISVVENHSVCVLRLNSDVLHRLYYFAISTDSHSTLTSPVRLRYLNSGSTTHLAARPVPCSLPAWIHYMKQECEITDTLPKRSNKQFSTKTCPNTSQHWMVSDNYRRPVCSIRNQLSKLRQWFVS